MAYAAKILCDSISPSGVRLTTIEVTFPRIVLAEFNTHRVLSRNSASSRAIPVKDRIVSVQKDPFVPDVFGKNQKGMQAGEVLRDAVGEEARLVWEKACNAAVFFAKELSVLGVHKQLANRLLEPFCWQTVIVTATEWDNFWGLRCNPEAQPEIQRPAELMRRVYIESTPRLVAHDFWHLPLTTDALDLYRDGFTKLEVARISAARCARVSYLTHEGERDPVADLALANRLETSGHMSPFEHVATPLPTTTSSVFMGNVRGWMQYRKMLPHEDNFLARLVADAATVANDP
jgi:thymidylate synthase ThyX